MIITVIDGQGGKMGAAVIEQIKNIPGTEITAIGTNSIATAAMLRAGASLGATGENPVLVACRDSNVIIGPVGIVIADSLLGEVTPAMAAAIGASKAFKILIPVNRCNHYIVGCQSQPLGDNIQMVVKKVQELIDRQYR